MYKKTLNNETLTGNDQFEGYCIDLLEKIASICNFTYKIKLVEDGFHGTIVNGKFNGIIGELVDKVLNFSNLNQIIHSKFIYILKES